MRWVSIFLFALLALAACEPTLPPSAPLRIGRIAMGATPVEPGKPPDFRRHFEEGTKVVYAYLWLENVRTMSGSFPVRAMWFAPNDWTPPVAVSTITMTPSENIAQFSFHDDRGIPRGPYEILFYAGPEFTATGSTRFFVAMTEEEAEEFLREEAEFERTAAP